MGQRWGRGGARLRPSRVPPPEDPTARSSRRGQSCASASPPSCSGHGFCFCMSSFLASFPPLFSPPPTAPHPPPPPFFSSFLFFCFFPSSSSRLPRAAARGDGAVGCSRWRAARRGARGSSPGSRQARGVRAGTHNHAPRAGGARGRAGRPCCAAGTRLWLRTAGRTPRRYRCGTFLHRWDGATAWSPASVRPAPGSPRLGGGAVLCWGPPGPPWLRRAAPSVCASSHRCCSAPLLCGLAVCRPPPPAAPHPALGRSPLFLWAGGDGLVVPRQRGGPASPRGLQHRAAFAAPRGPPVLRSLWGLSASARPCWGSELLGAGRGRCGLAGQSTATQEPQSAIQRGEPGPPPCGAATRDCCGVRAEAPRDGPPPPHRTAPH